jgi:hypothetical protein
MTSVDVLSESLSQEIYGGNVSPTIWSVNVELKELEIRFLALNVLKLQIRFSSALFTSSAYNVIRLHYNFTRGVYRKTDQYMYMRASGSMRQFCIAHQPTKLQIRRTRAATSPTQLRGVYSKHRLSTNFLEDCWREDQDMGKSRKYV